jgi:hypothetical protein
MITPLNNSTTLNTLDIVERDMDIRSLEGLDRELDKLELSYDLCLQDGLNGNPQRLQESHLKLREIIRKDREWRKELLKQLKKLHEG